MERRLDTGDEPDVGDQVVVDVVGPVDDRVVSECRSCNCSRFYVVGVNEVVVVVAVF